MRPACVRARATKCRVPHVAHGRDPPLGPFGDGEICARERLPAPLEVIDRAARERLVSPRKVSSRHPVAGFILTELRLMPNGDDKNWVRVCLTVDGFRARFGRWPAAVRLPPVCFEDLVGHVLTPAGYALVSSFFMLMSDRQLSENMAIIATGESGAEFRYGEDVEVNLPAELLAVAYFGSAILRQGLGCGLESVRLFDAQGNLVWAGKDVQHRTSEARATKARRSGSRKQRKKPPASGGEAQVEAD